RAGSDLAQAQALDRVVGVLAQYQGRARPRGQDVLHEVGPVDGVPDLARGQSGRLVGQVGVVREVRVRVREGCAAQLEEPLDVPVLDVVDLGVHVEREVEQVRHHEPGTGLQDVESLDDEDVRAPDLDVLVRDDVVFGVRVHRRADDGRSGLDLGDEPQQGPAVV